MPTKPVILCIDDEQNILDLLAFNLETAGYTAITATTGADGIAAAAGMPSLILLDLMLPDMEGTEVCKALKSNPATAGIPIRSPNPVQDNPPYLPALLFAVDHTNGLVVHHDMVEGVEYNPDEMLEDFVFGLTASKVYPERIMVRTEETIALLKEFCRRASIRLVKSERLDLLDEAVTTMKDWAENDSTDEIDQMMDALRQMSVDQIRMLPDFILMDLQKMSELLPKDIQDKIRKALG